MYVVVAVSGGIDSVVLLDMLVKSGEHHLVVAHFDHGMRDDSAADARFVQELAKKYGLEFVSRRDNLRGANEAEARDARYEFLFEQAKKRQAKLATAHHLDDLVETVVMNMRRGTRWRGLACMSDDRILRPLLKRTKSELRDYATNNHLEWVEDETNSQDKYTRNQIRRTTSTLSDWRKKQLFGLWQRQVEIKGKLKREINERDFPVHDRYFMIMVGQAEAEELIYEFVLRSTGVSLLSSQLKRLVMAIKVGRTGTVWQIAKGVEVQMGQKDWRIK